MIFDNRTKEIVNSIVGSFEVLKDHRGNNDRTGVLEVLSQGQHLFVKIHNRLDHWHPEVYAYRNWVKNIASFTPAMIAAFNDNEVFGIITTAITGKTVNEAKLVDEEKLIKVYNDAGKLLKKMQKDIVGTFFGIPKEDGSPLGKTVVTDPVEYVKSSLERLFALGYDKQLFGDAHRRLLQWCLDNCEVFRGEVPTITNWDFSQNNWMVDENGILVGFIDFENTLWGLQYDSFGVIIERYTFDKPKLRDAFFEGYDMPNDEITKIKMNILGIKTSFADIYNGYSHNHPRFFECGNRMLSRLMEII